MKIEQLLNSALYELYTRLWHQFIEKLPTDKGLSNPLFLKVPREYGEAGRRLLIVGQQTNGWGWSEGGWGELLGEDPVSCLMNLYEDFKLGEKYMKPPFFQAAHELNSRINPNGARYGFMWSNLIKIDQHGKQPDSQFENIICECEFLQREVAILRPDIIVFLTGPSYDDRLKRTFPGAELEDLGGKTLCRIRHPELPRNSFRTYHPKYLRLSRQWVVLERIAESFTEV